MRRRSASSTRRLPPGRSWARSSRAGRRTSAGRGSVSPLRRARGACRSSVFGFMTSLWPALFFLALAGGADFFSAVLRSTILMRVDAADTCSGGCRGSSSRRSRARRASATWRPACSRRSRRLRFSVVSGGVLCVIACAVTALALPHFRHYDSRRAALEPET